MDIHQSIPLKNYTTMKLGGDARFMTEVRTAEEVQSICKNTKNQNLPVFILGCGSNTIVRDEGFSGIVVRIRIPGIEIVADDLYSTTIKVGAGEIWDDFVAYTVEHKLTGIEAMSAIPGTVGAAPVQNIGAYGQEVADTIQELEAYDIESDQFVTLQNQDCQFAYRSSIFREESKGRYVITSVTFNLSKNLPQPPFYAALQKYFDENHITTYLHETVRQAVTAIRSDKLPDPTERPNAGSFFKNAVIDDWLLPELKAEYPEIPFYDMPNKRYKIPSGWLIEQAGFKGQLLSGMRVHDKNALVLINESAKSYADLESARDTITTGVRDKFRIELEQEPLEI